jgi:hypothetical protein
MLASLTLCQHTFAKFSRKEFHEVAYLAKGAMKLNSYLLKSTVVAALGGLLFGFETAVIAGTTHSLTETFHLSPAALGMTVSAALWGTILGSMLAAFPATNLAAATVYALWPCSTSSELWAAPLPGTGRLSFFFASSGDSALGVHRCSAPCTLRRSRPPNGEVG